MKWNRTDERKDKLEVVKISEFKQASLEELLGKNAVVPVALPNEDTFKVLLDEFAGADDEVRKRIEDLQERINRPLAKWISTPLSTKVGQVTYSVAGSPSSDRSVTIGTWVYDNAGTLAIIVGGGNGFVVAQTVAVCYDDDALKGDIIDLQGSVRNILGNLQNYSISEIVRRLDVLETDIEALKRDEHTEIWEEINNLQIDIVNLREDIGSYNTDMLREALEGILLELQALQELVKAGGIDRETLIKQIEIVLAGKRTITVTNGTADIDTAYMDDIVTLTADHGEETIPPEHVEGIAGMGCKCEDEWEIEEL